MMSTTMASSPRSHRRMMFSVLRGMRLRNAQRVQRRVDDSIDHQGQQNRQGAETQRLAFDRQVPPRATPDAADRPDGAGPDDQAQHDPDQAQHVYHIARRGWRAGTHQRHRRHASAARHTRSRGAASVTFWRWRGGQLGFSDDPPIQPAAQILGDDAQSDQDAQAGQDARPT